MPALGTRTVSRLCACGCGSSVPPRIRKSGPRKGQVSNYPPFIVGHGRQQWHAELRQRCADDPFYLAHAKPLGTTRLHKSPPNYVYRRIKVTPRGKWAFEHRYVMEQHIGRQLQRGEYVRHLNGNGLDNRLENLQLFSHSEHSKHHSKMSSWSKKHVSCVACHETVRKHEGRGLCTRCYQHHRLVASGHPFHDVGSI